jgi:hypothetical protein
MNKHIIRLLHQDINKIKKKRLTYLEEQAMLDLKNCILSIEERKVEGIMMEMGCALGGSAILISSNKQQQRSFKIYDVFGMIPSPGEKDDQDIHERYETITEGKAKGLGDDAYYGYTNDLLDKVKSTFVEMGVAPDDHNVSFVQGLYENTLNGFNEPVSFAHIDCDWYDSVMVCLENIVPHLSKGGVLVIDDYYVWSGCTKAVDDFFKGKENDFLMEEKSRLHITRK